MLGGRDKLLGEWWRQRAAMHERKKETKENIMEKGKYTNVAFSSVTGVPKNSAHEPIMVRNEKSHACKYVLTAKIGDFPCAEKAPLKFSESNRMIPEIIGVASLQQGQVSHLCI